MANHGTGFLLAAERICDGSGCPDPHCLLAYCHLVCTSIELSLKALLLGDGVSVKALRSSFRHDLAAMVGEVSRRNLVGEISAADLSIIRMMSSDYRERRYAYSLGGYSYRFPLPPHPFEVAKRLSEYVVKKCS